MGKRFLHFLFELGIPHRLFTASLCVLFIRICGSDRGDLIAAGIRSLEEMPPDAPGCNLVTAIRSISMGKTLDGDKAFELDSFGSFLIQRNRLLRYSTH
ncbi:hypothetical protein TNCT_622441 [Trichonephila clavata]|uniref:Uncharacterized protein n=1 Tax=Trichonephila clavata TaxID=2740835 RepID=A0A8X6KH59_TRICU|nr:hypothetical protein TNCT_622441 [Trichonephila clavata]